MVIGSLKSGYHVDEMYTMGLSNSQLFPDIKDGVTYSGEQLWQEYAMVDEDNRFDYEKVIENQINDVHPPLYYILIHTVFSLFPNTYSLYYLLIVNIVLGIIVFWQMVWLFKYFTKKEWISVLFSLFFIFTMGFVNNVVFFRMYVLLAVWTNALIMLFCKYKPLDKGWKYYALLIFILVGGMMTQYYFIIFAAFACVIYAIRVALEKNWKKLILSVISVAASAGISTLIFPAMWKHIFSGYRGREAFENLSADGFLESLWKYIDYIGLQTFGELFIFLLFLGITLFIVASKKFIQGNIKETIYNYVQLAVPSICYMLIVAQISPYKTDRYIMNVMGILYLIVFAILIQLAQKFSKYAMAGIMGIAFLVLFCSYKEGVPYLYTSESENVTAIENLDENVRCLFLYDSLMKILPNFLELESLDDIVFVRDKNLDLLNEDTYKNYDKLIVYIQLSGDTEDIINQLIEQNSELNSYTELFTSGYATAYYLE